MEDDTVQWPGSVEERMDGTNGGTWNISALLLCFLFELS